MTLICCNKPTIVLETRGAERVRECKGCGTRFKTEEVLKKVLSTKRGVKKELLQCPISKDEMRYMMGTYSSLKMIANDLHVSTTTLSRWIAEMDL